LSADRPDQPPSSAALESSLRSALDGEVRFDRLSRTIYATDASIYEITPAGVVLPASVSDVIATVNACREHDFSLVPRGGGTGLAGGAVGPGLHLDCSRHLNAIGSLNVEARTVEVQAGVVLDELNAELRTHGLQFAPDVATSSRATIGGMIANNSCGAYSIKYGRTVDHVMSISAVLSDGSLVSFEDREPAAGSDVAKIEKALGGIRDKNLDDIKSRYPKVLRSNGGYGLDRIGSEGERARASRIVCGSEGTLAVVVGATLCLVPIPSHRSLLVLHFSDMIAALAISPHVLRHGVAAVELVDRMIVDAGRSQSAVAQACQFLDGHPEALMVVEVHSDDQRSLDESVESLLADSAVCGSAYAVVRLDDEHERESVWRLRHAGLGLLMSRPGDAQPHAFVEDSAVAPERLAEYIGRFREIVQAHDTVAGYYAHASVGCIHVRPVLDLKQAADIERMQSIADSVSDLALEFEGAVTGEHGDGLVRSCWLEKLYGPTITKAFREVKSLFDPVGMMNPGKIVDSWPMTENLRQGASWREREVVTTLDFTPHESMAALAGMCSGVGQCRQTLVGTMCPSYVATRDEQHTTRARANALRIALSNRGCLDGLHDDSLSDVMDLCLSCKACKSECPTGVDMAKLKAEYLHQHHLRHGATPRARFLADLPHKLKAASRWPRVSNLVSGMAWGRRLVERRYGLDRCFHPPRMATVTFRDWYRRHRRANPNVGFARGRVAYMVDCWTNFLVPQVGMAAVTLLEAAGFHVLCPPSACCGRTAISAGLLGDARQYAREAIRALHPVASRVEAILGSEPSCILTIADEIPALDRSAAARRIASMAMPVDSFLVSILRADPSCLSFAAGRGGVRLHTHCHQKASSYASDALSLLRFVAGDAAQEWQTGCCGMAGSFGQEVEHYDVGRAIGEDRLFPAARAAGDCEVVVTGFSCRQQLAHHVGVNARHVLEVAADRLG
jgi:FAD/FMN-containing dehydrogenase/Fe-S oxidoreductase